jgi:hypothetical protein
MMDAMQPLLLGPDVTGRSVVLSGDRVCWFSEGEAPQFPRVRRVAAEAETLEPGGVIVLDLGGDPDEVRTQARSCLLAGVTGVVALASDAGGDDLPENLLVIREEVSRPGLRAAVGFRLRDAGSARAQAAAACLLANPRSLSRGVIALESDASDRLRQDAHDLADSLGVLVWEGRDDVQTFLARCFGRRLAPLSPGAAGDVVARGRDGVARHVVVGGHLLVSDGRIWEEGVLRG